MVETRLGNCASQIGEFMASESCTRKIMCAACPRGKELRDFANSQFEKLRQRKYEVGNQQAKILCGDWSFTAPVENEAIERDTKAQELALVEGLRQLPVPTKVEDLYDCADLLLKIPRSLDGSNEVQTFRERLRKKVNVSALPKCSRFPTESTMLLLELANWKGKMKDLVVDFFCNLVRSIPKPGSAPDSREGNGGPLADGLSNLFITFDDYFDKCWTMFFRANLGAPNMKDPLLNQISEKVNKECKKIIGEYESKQYDMSICAAFVRLSLLEPSELCRAVQDMLKNSAHTMATKWEKNKNRDTQRVDNLREYFHFLVEQFGANSEVLAELKWYSLINKKP